MSIRNRRSRAQGAIDFSIGIAALAVVAVLGFDTLRSGVHWYFTGDPRVESALHAAPPGSTPTPTPTPTIGPPTSTPTIGPSPTPTSTPSPVPTVGALQPANVQIGNCSPLLPALTGDPFGLAIIDVNSITTCDVIVTDPRNASAPVSGDAVLDTTALGGDPGVGHFFLGGVQQSAQTGLICPLTARAGGGAMCTFGYRPTFSGRIESGLLQAHEITATYFPAQSSTLSTNSTEADLRVKRITFVRMSVSDCGQWPLPLQRATTCLIHADDLDTGSGDTTPGHIPPPTSGTLTWNPALTPGLSYSPASSCIVNGATPDCAVALNPSVLNMSGFQWSVRFTPDPTDQYHSAGLVGPGTSFFTLIPGDAIRVDNLDCPGPGQVGTPVTCSVDVTNDTGPRSPGGMGSLNWLFNPIYSVTPAGCAAHGSNGIRCSVTFTPTQQSHPLTLNVVFIPAPNTFMASASSGPPQGVIDIGP